MPTKTNATQKAAALAGSAAALTAVVPESYAAVVIANDLPTAVVPMDDGNFVWDVDGDGHNDFRMRTFTNSSSEYFGGIDSAGGLRGSGMILSGSGTSFDAENLPTGFQVGETLAASYIWGVAVRSRYITHSSYRVGTDFINGNYNSDENYIGFRFDIGGNTHYGWAQLELRPYPSNLQIINAAYNDTPGAPINVGQIPEPSSLALLGLGVAGLGMLRRRKTK